MALPESFREQASLHHPNTAAGQPHPADAQDPHWHLEPMRNAPPLSSDLSEDERALSHQHASTSGTDPRLGKVSKLIILRSGHCCVHLPSKNLWMSAAAALLL